jgi:hypothetical protein
MYQLTQTDTLTVQAEKLAADKGLEPLRLVISGKSIIRLYCAPKPEERNDRVFRHVWVHMLNLAKSQSGLRVVDDKWKTLPLVNAAETTVKEWPGVTEWAGIGTNSAIETFEKKLELLHDSDVRELPLFYQDLTSEQLEELKTNWIAARRIMGLTSKYVVNPHITYQVGFVTTESNREEPKITPLFAGVDAASFLYSKKVPGVSEKYHDQYRVRQNRDKDLKNTVVRLRTGDDADFVKSMKIIPGFSHALYLNTRDVASKKGIEEFAEAALSHRGKVLTVYLDASFAKFLGVERTYRLSKIQYKKHDKRFSSLDSGRDFVWETRETKVWAPDTEPVVFVPSDKLEIED